MGADKIAMIGMALAGIGAGAFAAFTHELPLWSRSLLALTGLAVLIAAVSML